MSGQAIRVDQKGKGSKPLFCTPVVLTSNEDITQVRIGCETRPEHTEPIRDRVVAICLKEKLGGDFGLIPDGEFGKLFRTMAQLGYQPTMASYSAHWGQLPVYEENWSDPPIKDPQELSGSQELRDLLSAFAADVGTQPSEEEPEYTAATSAPLSAICSPITGRHDSLENSELPTPASFELRLLEEEVSRLCLEVSFIFNNDIYRNRNIN